MMLEKNSYFLKTIIVKYVVSSIISMLFLCAGSFIDTVIVGCFLKEEGLGAMSLIGPVYLIYYTLGATFGIGGSIVASRLISKGNKKDYNNIFSATVIILFVFAVVMTILGYVFINPFTKILSGGTDNILVKEYLLYYIPGGAFTLLSYVPLYFLKTEGKPKISSVLFAVSAVLNIVLSWLFMSPLFDMGIKGASLATTISMGLTTVFGFGFLMFGKTELKFLKLKTDFSVSKEIFISGTPNGLSNLLESIRILIINMLFIKISAAALLPCYTVVRNVSEIINSVAIGISYAIAPLMGTLFSEKDYENERLLLKLSKKVGLIIISVTVVAVCAFSKPVVLAFGIKNPEIIKEGITAIPLATIGFVFAYVNLLYTGYLTSVKREKLALLIVSLRLLAALVVLAYPLAMLAGVKGIWISLSLCEPLTTVIYGIVCRIIRNKNKNIDAFMLDKSKEPNGNISFSVKYDVDDIVSSAEKISEFCEAQDVDMKRSMKVSLAIEEILTFLIKHHLGNDENKYIDVRVCKLSEEVMVRFRYADKIFDPMTFYEENSGNEEMKEDLLGIKMITNSASLIEFKQLFGANNLLLIF